MGNLSRHSATRDVVLNSDIRAREQRNNVTGGDGDRANSNLASEVRSKLEANIPRGKIGQDCFPTIRRSTVKTALYLLGKSSPWMSKSDKHYF
jgi:hypothetical protein